MIRLDPAARAAATQATNSSSPTAATARAAPVPEPAGKPLKSYDGMFLGGNGQMYSPANASPGDLPTVKPQNGESKGLTVYVNGVGAKPQPNAMSEMQKYANASGNEVVGIYNATEGKLKDLLVVLVVDHLVVEVLQADETAVVADAETRLVIPRLLELLAFCKESQHAPAEGMLVRALTSPRSRIPCTDERKADDRRGDPFDDSHGEAH